MISREVHQEKTTAQAVFPMRQLLTQHHTGQLGLFRPVGAEGEWSLQYGSTFCMQHLHVRALRGRCVDLQMPATT